MEVLRVDRLQHNVEENIQQLREQCAEVLHVVRQQTVKTFVCPQT